MTTDAHLTPATYLKIWVALAVLLLAGVIISRFPLSKPMMAVAVLGLSTVKACLVGSYYMHLKVDRRWLTGVAVFPLVVILLAVLLVLSSSLVRL